MTLRERTAQVAEKCKIKHDYYDNNADGAQRSRYLWSPDLAPIEPARRTWGWYNFMNLWISASFNVNTWQLAGSYVAGGLAWWQGWLCIWAGYILTGIFVSLGGRVGAMYHVSFPVAIRSSFGIYGSIWPVLNRIVLAIIWYSVQSWIGGQCLYLMLCAVWPGTARIPNHLPASAQTDTKHMMCFFLFWLCQLIGIYFPLHKVRHLYTVKAVTAPIGGIAFAVWVAVRAGHGAGPVMSQSSSLKGSALTWTVIQAIISSLDNFSTFILNDSDFTRFSKKPSHALWSQLITVPVSFSLTSLVGLIVSSCSATLYGSPLWNPLDVLERFVTENPSSSDRAGVFFLALIFVYAQAMTNLTGANSAGSDFTALFPRYLNIRRGGYVAAVLSFACVPWKLLSSSNNFLAYVGAYSVFLSAFVGPYFCDYFIVRRGHLAVDQLYSNKSSDLYWGLGGFGINAYVGYLCGLIFNIVGVAGSMGASIPIGAWYLYQFNFLMGVLVSGGVYYLMCRFGPFKVECTKSWNETGDAALVPSIMINGVDPYEQAKGDSEASVVVVGTKDSEVQSVVETFKH
ncbi:hypothetical protein AYL99_04005 [Fonsecaea erecta]|uniref:NCS1 family nucleobase:cation symporter-1 n=1 Tax=Fonsecaea erecta TaxID=1367422 RepID=A0A178ZQ80_9EURO|nr:hypothetical protein AYL99_04005 [Fonsecaea erecta]OAP61802.1 hypothetical protein AYL99_04005 [Fonsecaea erecta]